MRSCSRNFGRQRGEDCSVSNVKKIAGEPVSRILFAARPKIRARNAAIIPLGPGSLRDSSSLPEGRSGTLLRARRIRAGPALPSYLALLHAGFSVPPALLPGRWALTPPFHPYQMRETERGELEVFPRACRRGTRRTGGLFSVALSVAEFPAPRSRAKPGAAPWSYQARCPTVAGSPK